MGDEQHLLQDDYVPVLAEYTILRKLQDLRSTTGAQPYPVTWQAETVKHRLQKACPYVAAWRLANGRGPSQ